MAWRAIAPEIEPDGISWAKGMGGGVPIGAFWVSDRAIDENGTALSSLMGPGSHGSTYGGNPLVCAAALAVLNEITEQDLAANATPPARPDPGNHRRLGTPRRAGSPRPRPADRHRPRPRGIATSPKARRPPSRWSPSAWSRPAAVPAGPDTVRLLPPLNVTDEEVDEALAILREAIADSHGLIATVDRPTLSAFPARGLSGILFVSRNSYLSLHS